LNRPLLLLTRPVQEAGRTIAAAAAVGFDTLSAPLLTIESLPFELPAGPFDALLFTSARAPDLVASRAPALTGLPAYAVGAHTGAALEAAGFRLVGEGLTDGSAILARAAANGARRLLHLAGEATAPVEVPAGLHLARVAVYAARRVAALSDEALAALREGRIFATLLFSARTSRHFSRLVTAAGLDRGGLRIVALSGAVAEAAGPDWAAVATANAPDIAEALAAAHRLWQCSEMGNDNG
jgi:uroporphyrinogen-III synthase